MRQRQLRRRHYRRRRHNPMRPYQEAPADEEKRYFFRYHQPDSFTQTKHQNPHFLPQATLNNRLKPLATPGFGPPV
jgi:hypothetical protein